MNFFRINIVVCIISFFVCANQTYASLPCEDLPCQVLPTESIATECLSAESLSTLDSLQPDQVMQDEDKVAGKGFKNLGSSVAAGALVANGLIFGGALHLFCAGQRDQAAPGLPPVIAEGERVSIKSDQERGVGGHGDLLLDPVTVFAGNNSCAFVPCNSAEDKVCSLGFIVCNNFDLVQNFCGLINGCMPGRIETLHFDKQQNHIQTVDDFSSIFTYMSFVFKININQANDKEKHDKVRAVIERFLGDKFRQDVLRNQIVKRRTFTIVLSFTGNNADQIKREYQDVIDLILQQYGEEEGKAGVCPVDRYTNLGLSINDYIHDGQVEKVKHYSGQIMVKSFNVGDGVYDRSREFISEKLTEENIQKMFGLK